MRINPDHDYDDPAGAAKAERALAYVQQMPPCPTCKAEHTVVPGPGSAWDIETAHEQRCPEHDDNVAATEVHLTDLYDGQHQVIVEALWQLDEHDPRGEAS